MKVAMRLIVKNLFGIFLLIKNKNLQKFGTN